MKGELVRLFEVEFAKEARYLKSHSIPLTDDLVRGYLNLPPEKLTWTQRVVSSLRRAVERV